MPRTISTDTNKPTSIIDAPATASCESLFAANKFIRLHLFKTVGRCFRRKLNQAKHVAIRAANPGFRLFLHNLRCAMDGFIESMSVGEQSSGHVDGTFKCAAWLQTKSHIIMRIFLQHMRISTHAIWSDDNARVRTCCRFGNASSAFVAGSEAIVMAFRTCGCASPTATMCVVSVKTSSAKLISSGPTTVAAWAIASAKYR